MSPEFRDLLIKVRQQFRNQRAFATALDMSLGNLNRALNKADYTFNVENCLRLARLSGEPPSRVLRVAGKSDLADLIEWLYGSNALTVPQKHLLEHWDRLPAPVQTALLNLLRALADATGNPSLTASPKRHASKRR